jgi:hypothetical protein
MGVAEKRSKKAYRTGGRCSDPTEMSRYFRARGGMSNG